MRRFLASSLVLILLLLIDSSFAIDPSFAFLKKRAKDPTLMIGLKVPIDLEAYHSTKTNLSFLDSGGGSSFRIGLSVDFIPFTFLDIETGFYYRYSSLLNSDLSLNELYFPMILKLRFPISSEIIFLIGGGTAYFHALSGKVVPSYTVSSAFGQRSISLPKEDLRNGFSLIFKAEVQAEIVDEVFLSFELGYEKSKRSLDIVTHDIILGIGMIVKVF
ncbi:MAG: hypothetical protein IEMM0008_1705 [bacterium]|nr:MAG: hypothetical protein IEMM0008_1705 [bacterium]